MDDLRKKIEEHNRRIEKLTCSTKELAEMLGISINKARQIVRAKDFPTIKIGRERRIIIDRVEKWLDNNIGMDF